MVDTRFKCLPTMIGSMPHIDPAKAWNLVTRFLPDIPVWPQLPYRSFNEDINVQYSEGFPGVVIKNKRVFIDSVDISSLLEKLYTDYLDDKPDSYGTSLDHASGLYELRSSGIRPLMVKGQVVGPVTWGLSVLGNDGKAIIYDTLLADAIPKFLHLKAAWQEKFLSRISKNTLIFVDEPYMVTFGSATFTLKREKIIESINEVFKGLQGIKGIHCCGNTDWSVLLDTDTDVISYDTYGYPESLSLYPAEVKRLLERGGAIAWGIVPNTQEALKKESAASLKDRLEEVIAHFTRRGIDHIQLIEHSLLTPSCGLVGLSEEMAEHALTLLADLSKTVRAVYIK